MTSMKVLVVTCELVVVDVVQGALAKDLLVELDDDDDLTKLILFLLVVYPSRK